MILIITVTLRIISPNSTQEIKWHPRKHTLPVSAINWSLLLFPYMKGHRTEREYRSNVCSERILQLHFFPVSPNSNRSLHLALHDEMLLRKPNSLSFYQNLPAVKLRPGKCFLPQEHLDHFQNNSFYVKNEKQTKKSALICEATGALPYSVCKSRDGFASVW